FACQPRHDRDRLLVPPARRRVRNAASGCASRVPTPPLLGAAGMMPLQQDNRATGRYEGRERMDLDDAPVLLTFDGDVATLTLNRPRYRNAADLALLEGLIDAADRIEAERPRVVVLRGAGPAFCAGIDLRAMQAAATPEESRHLITTMHRALG